MRIKLFFLLTFLTISTSLCAWRIENGLLYLEEAAKVYEITYKLTGVGNNWKMFWETIFDKTIKNPQNSYPNMKFEYENLNFEIIKFQNKIDSSFESSKRNLTTNELTIKIEPSLERHNKILGMDESLVKIIISLLIPMSIFLIGFMFTRKVEDIKNLSAKKFHWNEEWDKLLFEKYKLFNETLYDILCEIEIFKSRNLLNEENHQKLLVDLKVKREDAFKFAMGLQLELDLLKHDTNNLKADIQKIYQLIADDKNIYKTNSISKHIVELHKKMEVVFKKNI